MAAAVDTPASRSRLRSSQSPSYGGGRTRRRLYRFHSAGPHAAMSFSITEPSSTPICRRRLLGEPSGPDAAVDAVAPPPLPAASPLALPLPSELEPPSSSDAEL